jgi:predicted small lipoprotein YifL
MSRRVGTLRASLALALVALPLAGCAKKAPPDPPDHNHDAFPRTYPSDNDDPRTAKP